METEYKHIDANIYNHKFWSLMTDPLKLKSLFHEVLENSGFTIILFKDHHFQEQGYTCFWLLGESHLAIHTFPESRKSYIELSSCNKDKLDAFIQIVTTNSQYKTI